jgi:hypothetical protein
LVPDNTIVKGNCVPIMLALEQNETVLLLRDLLNVSKEFVVFGFGKNSSSPY